MEQGGEAVVGADDSRPQGRPRAGVTEAHLQFMFAVVQETPTITLEEMRILLSRGWPPQQLTAAPAVGTGGYR